MEIRTSSNVSSECHGDTIRCENDKLYINDKETDEPYLADYIKRFKDDKPKAQTQARALKEIKELSLEVLLKKPKPLQLMSTIIPTLALLSQKENTFSSETTA